MKNEEGVIKISVRSLVEFILRDGDIDNRTGKATTALAMLAGGRMHRKIQKSMGRNYQAEVPLKLSLDLGAYRLVIEGRADGILIEGGEDGREVTIDEIKGVYKNLALLSEPVGVHRAQAMCYAYIYALQQNLPEIFIQLTYCNLDTEDRRYFKEKYTFAQLSDWFDGLIAEYKKWSDFQFSWKKLRQDSIKRLLFPYDYREGQKELASDVYRTIARKKTLFIQAPTGAGKTIATVFPAVKAVGEGLAERIFYLTAKTVTGTVAKEAFSLLRRQGYQAKTVQIIAKEKLCLCEEMDCNPVHCPYAKGHFDRVNDAVFELLQKEDLITRESLLAQAKTHFVCPFEMCLDTASWADNIICDYNYIFDPNVYLRRFFAEGERGEYIFLVDEAHNLVERSREMYSAIVYKEDFLAMKKQIKPYSGKLTNDLEKCNRIMLAYKRECEKYVIYNDIGSLMAALQKLTADLDEFLQNVSDFPGRKDVFLFYMNLCNFRNIYELVDSRYVIYTDHDEDGRFLMKLYCVDPSGNLQERIEWANAVIFFSATLLPIQYYKSLLSTKQDNYAVYAKTSFSDEQRLLLIANDVSSKYTRRDRREFEKIAFYIYRIVTAKTGNYMVFFPSYQMMRQVHETFAKIYGEEVECMLQQAGMKEEEREQFLNLFSKEAGEKRGRSFAAFCVLGGIFGEGIDLKKEQLIGALVVGTGLPGTCNEREILMHYYDEQNGAGFDYAYRYPGMNKVLQAGGRVIRTAEDVGVIALLDERFLQREYQGLFPREWEQRRVCSADTIGDYLQDFWNSD